MLPSLITVSNAGMPEKPLDDYEHAFRVRPEAANSDAWLLYPDSSQEAAE